MNEEEGPNISSLIVIPARMGSSRFPGKPLAPILGRPMIKVVIDNALDSNLATKVVVATCDEEIAEASKSSDVEVILTGSHHKRATSRTNEAFQYLQRSSQNFDQVIMLQGDEPCITGEMLDAQIRFLEENVNVMVTNLTGNFTSREELMSANSIKVAVGHDGRILFMSRAPILSTASQSVFLAKKQVCSISFSGEILDLFEKQGETEMEHAESIDMLRLLEMDIDIRAIPVPQRTHPVDIPSDLATVERILQNLDEPGM